MVMVVDILSKQCHLPFWLRRLVRLPILRFLFATSCTSGESPDESQKHPGSDLHILFPRLTGANISLPSLASPCKAGGCEDEVGGRVTTWQMRTQNAGWGSGADKVRNLCVSKHAGLPPPALESQ